MEYFKRMQIEVNYLLHMADCYLESNGRSQLEESLYIIINTFLFSIVEPGLKHHLLIFETYISILEMSSDRKVECDMPCLLEFINAMKHE